MATPRGKEAVVTIKRGIFSNEVVIPPNLQNPVVGRRPSTDAQRSYNHPTLCERIQRSREFGEHPVEEIFILGPYFDSRILDESFFLGKFSSNRGFSLPPQSQMMIDKARAIGFGVKINDTVYEVAEGSPWLQTQYGNGRDETSGLVLIGLLDKPKAQN